MTPLEVLKGARKLLSDPAKWTKQHSARDKLGNPVPSLSPSATCWCVLGACSVVAKDIPVGWLAADLLKVFAMDEHADIAQNNDAEDMTHQHLLEWMDAAIAKAEGEGK